MVNVAPKAAIFEGLILRHHFQLFFAFVFRVSAGTEETTRG